MYKVYSVKALTQEYIILHTSVKGYNNNILYLYKIYVLLLTTVITPCNVYIKNVLCT